MANLHSLFRDLESNINLSPTRKKNIERGRDALREKISDNFQEKNRNKPKYCMQGSYAMRTAITPLENKEFDLDNGVYLQGSSEDQESWPTTTLVHTWVENAVDGHTDTPPVDKNTCIRVIYKDDYHIDLPIYIMGVENIEGEEQQVAYLAHKTNGWVISDPKAFTDWFIKKVNEHGEQLRRIVKYMKSWKDNKNIDLKGIAITILVCNHFSGKEQRDDIALLDTITNILDEIEDNFHCFKPVTPKDEDLFANISYTKQQDIIKKLNNLKQKLDQAIYQEKNQKKSSEIIQKEFGDRFPLGKDEEEDSFATTDSPVSLGGHNSHFA